MTDRQTGYTMFWPRQAGKKAFKQGYLRGKNKTSAFPEQQIREQLAKTVKKTMPYQNKEYQEYSQGVTTVINDAVESMRELWEQK